MPYISGEFDNLINRMHQFATGLSVLNSYVQEGGVYLATGLYPPFMSGKLENEARKRKFIFSGSGEAFNEQIF